MAFDLRRLSLIFTSSVGGTVVPGVTVVAGWVMMVLPPVVVDSTVVVVVSVVVAGCTGAGAVVAGVVVVCWVVVVVRVWAWAAVPAASRAAITRSFFIAGSVSGWVKQRPSANRGPTSLKRNSAVRVRKRAG